MMKVLALSDDHVLLKVKLLKAFLSVELEIEVVDESSLKEFSANGIVLIHSEGTVTQPIAIVTHLGSLVNSDKIFNNVKDCTLLIEALSSIQSDLEIPLEALKATSTLPEAEQFSIRSKVEEDIKQAWRSFNEKIALGYLVGPTLSVADISLLGAYLESIRILDKSVCTLSNIEKWASTISSIPEIKSVIESSSVYSSILPRLRRFEFNKWDRHRIRVKELLSKGLDLLDQEVVVKGWVRTLRSADKGSVIFVELTDGSTVKGVQLVINASDVDGADDVANCGGAGASLAAKGKIVRSLGKGQDIEISVTKAKVLGPVYGGENGEVGGKNYPMAKKKHTLEFLREKAHLRPRSKLFSAAMRIRHAMAFATHKFFNDRGFVYVHTPLITAADCEGAGEQFVVTTLLPENVKPSTLPTTSSGNIDFSKDFFSRRCCLTVSGQLNVETHACALSDVYTFGPTFRAENSHTARHLAEFWMIEPEICFADLFDNMNLAEDYVKFCTAYALENCADDLYYLENEYPEGEKGLRKRLENVLENEFVRITYTEAVELVQKHAREGLVKFETFPQWGDDLGSEHERYITEKVFGKPTIVINYPKGIKAFYMKLNDDKETVAAMDILVPKIGELIGGSQREDNLLVLEERCESCGINKNDVWWYSDLRRYGTVPHAGFGLGFERLVMFVTGIENIRDVIPFPRVPGHAEF